jgi:hypothetical protein
MYLVTGKPAHWEKRMYFLHFADDQLMKAQDCYDDVEHVISTEPDIKLIHSKI